MTKPSSSRKIRVCLVAISLGRGGADRSCAMLSRMLEEQGFEVHLAILNDCVEYAYSGELLNLGTDKVEGNSLFKRVKRLKKLKQYLRKKKIDIVIDHRAKNDFRREWLYKKYVYKGIKTVYVVHSFRQRTYFGQKPARFSKLYRNNFKNIAVSNAIAKSMENDLGLSNFTTIYNAFDPVWIENAQVQVAVPEGEFVLSYGRLDDEVKDFSFLLRSFEASGLWKEKVTLVIMGDGKDREKLMALTETLGITSQVWFLPFVTNPFPFIEKAHIVALTSKYEGFPMVLLESLSLGTPVVSLDIASGPSEIIRDRKNGLLIPKREVPLFAQGLVSMFHDNALYDDCSEYAQRSVSRFSRDEIARQWANILTHE